MLNGVIFDFDGTLFDTMKVWDTAGEAYLRSVGREPEETLRAVLHAMSLSQAARYLREQYRIPLPEEEIIRGISRITEAFYLEEALPKPGAAAFLEELRRKGVRMCIATATERYQVEAALRRCGLRDFFSEIITCGEAGCGKDQPLIYRTAMKRLQTNRADTVVVEDAYHAVCTAKRDGFRVAAVYDAYESRQRETAEAADVYLPDYTDLTAFWAFAGQTCPASGNQEEREDSQS